jgi:hypothetical protein
MTDAHPEGLTAEQQAHLIEQALKLHIEQRVPLSRIGTSFTEAGMSKTQREEALAHIKKESKTLLSKFVEEQIQILHGRPVKDIRHHFKQMEVYADIKEYVDYHLHALEHQSQNPGTSHGQAGQTQAGHQQTGQNPNAAQSALQDLGNTGWVIFIILALALGLIALGKVKKLF